MMFVNTLGHYLLGFCLLLFELEFTVRIGITIAFCQLLGITLWIQI